MKQRICYHKLSNFSNFCRKMLLRKLIWDRNYTKQALLYQEIAVQYQENNKITNKQLKQKTRLPVPTGLMNLNINLVQFSCRSI